MSATATLLTVDQFLELPEKDDVRRELDEGVVIEMAGGAPRHEIAKANITALLAAWNQQAKRGKVFSEAMFALRPATYYIPDVAWVSAEWLRSQDLDQRVFRRAPDLAVEVVSSETAARLERKVRAYLREGSRRVWAAFLEERAVIVYRPDGSSQLLVEEQLLREPELLPEFDAKVSEFFEGV